jgi:hypothetical protein
MIFYDSKRTKPVDIKPDRGGIYNLKDNKTYYVFGFTYVLARNKTRVNVFENATVWAIDNATVNAFDNSKVRVFDNAKVFRCIWISVDKLCIPDAPDANNIRGIAWNETKYLDKRSLDLLNK